MKSKFSTKISSKYHHRSYTSFFVVSRKKEKEENYSRIILIPNPLPKMPSHYGFWMPEMTMRLLTFFHCSDLTTWNEGKESTSWWATLNYIKLIIELTLARFCITFRKDYIKLWFGFMWRRRNLDSIIFVQFCNVTVIFTKWVSCTTIDVVSDLYNITPAH